MFDLEVALDRSHPGRTRVGKRERILCPWQLVLLLAHKSSLVIELAAACTHQAFAMVLDSCMPLAFAAIVVDSCTHQAFVMFLDSGMLLALVVVMIAAACNQHSFVIVVDSCTLQAFAMLLDSCMLLLVFVVVIAEYILHSFVIVVDS